MDRERQERLIRVRPKLIKTLKDCIHRFQVSSESPRLQWITHTEQLFCCCKQPTLAKRVRENRSTSTTAEGQAVARARAQHTESRRMQASGKGRARHRQPSPAIAGQARVRGVSPHYSAPGVPLSAAGSSVQPRDIRGMISPSESLNLPNHP
jgi:hypothetical protein